jgi:hypothetical protein
MGKDLLISQGIPYRHGLVTDEVEADDLGCSAGHFVAKMTIHGIPNHFPEFFESIALGGDGMT